MFSATEEVKAVAADMRIHILMGITEDDLRLFFCSTLGSKYFDPYARVEDDRWNEVHDKVAETPSVWVGEVSWLKASLLGDDAYVPAAVQKISELIGEDLPVIDDALIQRVEQALSLPNDTPYAVADAKSVVEFLRMYRGERCFTVSW